MDQSCGEHAKHFCFSVWQCCLCLSTGEFDDNDGAFPLEEQQISHTRDERETTNNTKYNEIGGGGGGGSNQIQEAEDAIDEEAELNSSFDPDEAYCINFEHLGTHTLSTNKLAHGIIASHHIEIIIEEHETILTNSGIDELTPREVSRSLSKYENSIRLIDDLEKKKGYIDRYEMHKSNHDRENPDDRMKAEFYLENARNPRTDSHDRIEYFQTAIKFTNNLVTKERIRSEYKEYCFSLQKGNTPRSTLSKK